MYVSLTTIVIHIFLLQASTGFKSEIHFPVILQFTIHRQAYNMWNANHVICNLGSRYFSFIFHLFSRHLRHFAHHCRARHLVINILIIFGHTTRHLLSYSHFFKQRYLYIFLVFFQIK